MNKKQFNSLKNTWYKKLKNEGFKDVETKQEIMITSGNFSLNRFQTRSSYDSFKNKERYYQLAGHFLYEHEFKNDIHKTIWKLHSEGLSGRGISNIIKILNKTQIYDLINLLKQEMLKKYTMVNHEKK